MRIIGTEQTQGAPATPSTSAPQRRFTIRRLVAIIVVLAIAAGIGYFAVCGYVATQLTKPERHSQINTPAAFGLEFEDTVVTARDGLALAGWFIPYAGSDRAVAVIHGKGQCRSCEFDGRFLEFAAGLHAGGFNLLLVDLRAHGQSEGRNFTLGDQERLDVLGAVDWLQGRGFENIGVHGVSLGAVSSVAAASDPESGHLIKALVLDSSFSDLAELLSGRFTEESGLPNLFFPGSLFMARLLMGTNAHAIKPVDDLPHVEAPVMVIFAGQDATVPIDQLQAMAAARSDAETWFVPAAAHARIYNAEPEQYVTRVTQFFDTVLR